METAPLASLGGICSDWKVCGRDGRCQACGEKSKHRRVLLVSNKGVTEFLEILKFCQLHKQNNVLVLFSNKRLGKVIF